MNLTSISGNAGFSRTAVYDKAISMLEKQKERIQTQIRKINESDLDKETKQEYVKVLKTQIDMIDAQIEQKRAEKTTQSAKQAAEKKSDAEGSEKQNQKTGYKADLVKAEFTAVRADLMKETKDKLDGRGRVLSQEIALDAGRGAAVSVKQEELRKLETNKWKLDGKIGEALHAAETEAERGAKASEDPEKSRAGGAPGKTGRDEPNKSDLQPGETEAEVLAENTDLDGKPAEKKKIDMLV